MGLFDKPAKILGKNRGMLTIKWAALSELQTNEELFVEEDIRTFLKDNPKLIKQLEKNKEELTVEWASDDENFENVNVEKFNYSTLTLDDNPSIKYLQIEFNFDTKLNLKRDNDTIIDSLRFGFSMEIEFSTKSGFILFKFNELQDNSIEIL
jgi:hypothetical protein